MSLPAAFVAAGYAAVIGSRWPVDALSTTLLMGEFYRKWFGGKVGVARALRDARRWLRNLSREKAADLARKLPDRIGLPDDAFDLLASCEDAADAIQDGPSRPFADPKHWAAFFVIGDGSLTADELDRRMPKAEKE